ncbi:cupin [Elstera cyanobacteriorum]|uniref:Cupin n=1 Tax=Elstera cyanobacteriorum TaxID=2022747 RepID=A0A255XY98_9PROT|nr:cupin domain-containing protein [Elstera cyanobacteriorum]OYQ21902.1 cupin [Elstera cyanobacteriorum]GGA02580.1 cupin [Elstera cyanobacteriorum]
MLRDIEFLDLSPTAMAQRLVRYADLVPCSNAFVDTRTPGSDAKENFTIIGPGVAENPDQFVHIREPHGFNIGGARQPENCINSQHSHETAEVFVVHTGRWRLIFGPNREDGTLDIGPGDVVSVPTRMFRGFKKIDAGTGFLWVVLGGDDPGRVRWAPEVFELAERYGLKLLKSGLLFDMTSGTRPPVEAEFETPPAADEVAALATPPRARLLECYLPAAAVQSNPASLLTGNGVDECGVIGPRASGDGFAPGPIVGWWHHGFTLRRLDLIPGGATPWHRRAEAEVLFVQSGSLEVAWPNGTLTLAAGDTLTLPVGLTRRFASPAETTQVFIVRGGDAPAAAERIAG